MTQRGGSVLTAVPVVHITPHIDLDGLITMNLDFGQLLSKPGSPNSTIGVAHLVPSGSMTVYDMTGMTQPSKYRMFLFVTPTLVSAGANDGTITVKP